jgi:hypothetical protein
MLTVVNTVELDGVWRAVVNTANPVVAIQPKFFQGTPRPYPANLRLEFRMSNSDNIYSTQPRALRLFDGFAGGEYLQWTILPWDEFRPGEMQRRYIRSVSLVGLVIDVAVGGFADLA